LVGAAAFLGGVTRMTISLVVIMFELTGGLTYTIPITIACMVSKWVSDGFHKDGIYDEHIKMNNYPFLDNKKPFLFQSFSGQVMRPKPGTGEPPLIVIVQEGMKVKDVRHKLAISPHNGFPVVVSEESQYLVGFVWRKDLSSALNHAETMSFDSDFENKKVSFTAFQDDTSEKDCLRLRYLIDLAPITITDQTPMENVVDMFIKLGLRHVLVTHNSKLLGVVTKKDVLNHIAYVENVSSKT